MGFEFSLVLGVLFGCEKPASRLSLIDNRFNKGDLLTHFAVLDLKKIEPIHYPVTDLAIFFHPRTTHINRTFV